MGKWGWFGCDDETGEVLSKTEQRSDGTVHRYEYTTPDKIKEGHGHKVYDSMEDFLKDNPSWARDKNALESLKKKWKGNGYDLGITDLEQLSLEELYSLKTTFIHSTAELMLDEMMEEQISHQASKHR